MKELRTQQSNCRHKLMFRLAKTKNLLPRFHEVRPIRSVSQIGLGCKGITNPKGNSLLCSRFPLFRNYNPPFTLLGFGEVFRTALQTQVKLFDTGDWEDGFFEQLLGLHLAKELPVTNKTREDVVLMSKTSRFSPNSLESSLERLKTPYLDCFLVPANPTTVSLIKAEREEMKTESLHFLPFFWDFV